MTTRSYSLIPRQYYLVDYYDRRSALDNDVDEVSGFRSRDRLRRRTTAILLSPFMNRIHHVSLHLHRDWLSGVGGVGPAYTTLRQGQWTSPFEDGAAVCFRQIRNVFKTAQMLARRANGDGKVNMGHIEAIPAIERGKEFAKA